MYLLQYAEDDERPASWPASQIVARRVSTNVKALKKKKNIRVYNTFLIFIGKLIKIC